MRSQIAGREILTTGTVVGKKGDIVSIYPFESSPHYCLKFIHSGAIEGPDNTTNIYIASENNIHMELTHRFRYPNYVTVTRTIFGNDKQYLYAINYYMQFIGELDSYTFVFNYTIYTEPNS